MGKDMREASREKWSTPDNATLESLNCGSLMRIADSLEKIAQDKLELERGRDYWKSCAKNFEALLNTERKRSAALKGYLARLKKLGSDHRE